MLAKYLSSLEIITVLLSFYLLKKNSFRKDSAESETSMTASILKQDPNT